MSATHPTTGHSCEPPTSRPWPRVVIAIVVIAVVVYAMATGYDVAAAITAATGAGFGAVAVARRLAH
ncbi:hypothetical protein SUDANB121_05874 (plasmid) [Nocardiopsis dassonvillei]|uniref:hypothetical protein n=1 Tax=Nocardiopsis dassonvillei TaxID=2014 RepID=UPI003F577E38